MPDEQKPSETQDKPQDKGTEQASVQQDQQQEKPQDHQPQGTSSNGDDKTIKELRSENAARRVENKELKEKLAELEPKAKVASGLAERLAQVESDLTKKAAEADQIKRTAIFQTSSLPEDTVKILQEQLKDVPTDKLEAVVKGLASTLPPKQGWTPSLSGSSEVNDKDRAKRIFERIGNRGSSALDPEVHRSKGGGFYTE